MNTWHEECNTCLADVSRYARNMLKTEANIAAEREMCQNPNMISPMTVSRLGVLYCRVVALTPARNATV